MYGICHIRPVSVGLDRQIWNLFIYITGYLNVRKISETMDFRTFVGPLQEVKCMGIFQYYLVDFLIVLVHYASQRLLHLYEGVYEQSIAL